MIQPSNTEKQSILSVIKDLESHHRRLGGAIEWTKNVAAAVDLCRQRGAIEFSALGRITEGVTSVGILLALPTGGVVQDVQVTTLVCRESIDTTKKAATVEAMRLTQTLQWQEVLGVKVLETWFVDSKQIWQGSDDATETWLTTEVRRWLAYWFPAPPKAVFRSVKTMEIVSLGKKSLT